MVSTPDDFFFFNLPSLICMLPIFFPGNIHHLTSSEMVVKTMQRSRGARKCLFTAVKRKPLSSSLFLSPCLCLCFPCPKYPSPPSIKSYWSMTHSDLTTSIQVSLVVLTRTAVTFPKLWKDVQTLLHSEELNYNGLSVVFLKNGFYLFCQLDCELPNISLHVFGHKSWANG